MTTRSTRAWSPTPNPNSDPNQVLDHDHQIHTRMEPHEIASSRAELVASSRLGDGQVALPPARARRRRVHDHVGVEAKPLPKVPHLVRRRARRGRGGGDQGQDRVARAGDTAARLRRAVPTLASPSPSPPSPSPSPSLTLTLTLTLTLILILALAPAPALTR